MSNAPQADKEDPELAQFLGFPSRDLATHPERLQSIERGLIERMQGLVGHVEIDLEAPLSPDDQ